MAYWCSLDISHYILRSISQSTMMFDYLNVPRAICKLHAVPYCTFAVSLSLFGWYWLWSSNHFVFKHFVLMLFDEQKLHFACFDRLCLTVLLLLEPIDINWEPTSWWLLDMSQCIAHHHIYLRLLCWCCRKDPV